MKGSNYVLSLLLASTVCVAQSVKRKSSEDLGPDLSGTWVLDEAKSHFGLEHNANIKDYMLTIAHREPEIRISKKFKRRGREVKEELIYHTDGRLAFSSLYGYREAVTRWRRRKLVSRSATRIGGALSLEVSTTEEWALSEDGKILTETVSSTGLGQPISTKLVFTRLP
jgi:hypothetical protein